LTIRINGTLVSSGFTLTNGIEYHPPDNDADAKIISIWRLKSVTTFQLFVSHQQKTIANQIDRSVGFLQDPVAQSLGHNGNFFRQKHVKQIEIHF
jgi:hypothetical protein